MKNLLSLLILILTATLANAQIVFKNGIQPNTTYTTNREMNMVMNMTPPEALASMAGGQAMKMEMTFNTTSTLATSAKNKAGQIPVTFTSKVGANKISMNGQEMPANMIGQEDTQMSSYGRYDGNKIVVDSIGGKAMNDSLRTMMNQIIETARNGSKFPEHALKVGDTFISDAPFALPLPGMSQKNPMDVKSTYKLVSLNNGVGVFDMTMTINVNVNQSAAGQNMGVAVSGIGNGTMTFDIKKEYYTDMNLKMSIDFGINTGEMELKGKGDLMMTDKVNIVSK